VLQWANWLACECDAPLGIAYATPEIDRSAASWNLEEEFNRQVTADAVKRIADLQKQAGTNASEVLIASGKPEAVVAREAANFNADLVVIGRHSGAGIAGHLFQNAYAILREAPCPVVSI
jgi:nucleotide-binding universal stress UspA family protein